MDFEAVAVSPEIAAKTAPDSERPPVPTGTIATDPKVMAVWAETAVKAIAASEVVPTCPKSRAGPPKAMSVTPEADRTTSPVSDEVLVTAVKATSATNVMIISPGDVTGAPGTVEAAYIATDCVW